MKFTINMLLHILTCKSSMVKYLPEIGEQSYIFTRERDKPQLKCLNINPFIRLDSLELSLDELEDIICTLRVKDLNLENQDYLFLFAYTILRNPKGSKLFSVCRNLDFKVEVNIFLIRSICIIVFDIYNEIFNVEVIATSKLIKIGLINLFGSFTFIDTENRTSLEIGLDLPFKIFSKELITTDFTDKFQIFENFFNIAILYISTSQGISFKPNKIVLNKKFSGIKYDSFINLMCKMDCFLSFCPNIQEIKLINIFSSVDIFNYLVRANNCRIYKFLGTKISKDTMDKFFDEKSKYICKYELYFIHIANNFDEEVFNYNTSNISAIHFDQMMNLKSHLYLKILEVRNFQLNLLKLAITIDESFPLSHLSNLIQFKKLYYLKIYIVCLDIVFLDSLIELLNKTLLECKISTLKFKVYKGFFFFSKIKLEKMFHLSNLTLQGLIIDRFSIVPTTINVLKYKRCFFYIENRSNIEVSELNLQIKLQKCRFFFKHFIFYIKQISSKVSNLEIEFDEISGRITEIPTMIYILELEIISCPNIFTIKKILNQLNCKNLKKLKITKLKSSLTIFYPLAKFNIPNISFINCGLSDISLDNSRDFELFIALKSLTIVQVDCISTEFLNFLLTKSKISKLKLKFLNNIFRIEHVLTEVVDINSRFEVLDF